MGMGEPMANYKAVIGAVRRLTDPAPDGLGMSARGVTVSTVGLVPRMRQLADEGIPVTLALSLHAPDDELRNELVPINTRFSVAETVEAAWEYADKTRRRVSIEYAMMRGINDQAWRADLLADVLHEHGDLGLGARQPDPAQPHAGLEVDRLGPRRRARVRAPARGARHPDHRPRHPRPRDRRRLRPAGRDRGLSRLDQGGCYCAATDGLRMTALMESTAVYRGGTLVGRPRPMVRRHRSPDGSPTRHGRPGSCCFYAVRNAGAGSTSSTLRACAAPR